MEQPVLPPPFNKPDKKNRSNNSMTTKIFLILFVMTLLFILIKMVQNLISERTDTATEATVEVQQKWGLPQDITGPLLAIPYDIYIKGKDTTINTVTHYMYILPDDLRISGNLNTEELKRGLYDIVVYRTPLELSGKFDLSFLSEKEINSRHLKPNEAQLVIGITDLRGLTEQVEGIWDNQKLKFNPGTDNNLISSGVSCPVSLTGTQAETTFKIKLQMKGSGSIMFTPLGEKTDVLLKSNCLTPSFDGAFLPEKRDVNDKGFSADWKILHMNRNYPQIFMDENREQAIKDSKFGVNLLLPVDQYQKSERTIKYSFIIIILTFVVCFFVDILQKKNIHPIQYLLIGMALCLFYTLLVAISEHLNFTISYVIATVMTISLLTAYLWGILKIRKTALTIGSLLLLLYIYVFFIIQMEIYTLLVGSIGMFIILAVIMYYSQKIDWYNLKNREIK